MKHIIPFLFFCCLAGPLAAQDFFQFKFSQPYNVLQFMQTAVGRQGTSSTYRQFIQTALGKDEGFAALCKRFGELDLDYNFQWAQFPETRRTFRSTYDLLVVQAVRAKTLADLQAATIGLMPTEDQRVLFEVLNQAAVYYERIIWAPNKKAALKQQKALRRYADTCADLFLQFNQFYRSTWSKDAPFTVALYPIPGARGNTTATPHFNSLCVSFLTGEKDYAARIGVVVHEMCHVLYDEQSSSTQHEIASWFEASPSPYAKFAYSYFDEGLATALGNGYGFKVLAGQLDTTEWYNDVYINGFAKAIYPMVERYLAQKKPLDQAFVHQAIEVFGQQFPDANADYSILFNKVNVYAENLRWNDLQPLQQTFRIYSSNLSTPVQDPYSLESLTNSPGAQLVVLEQNQADNLAKLATLFPELKTATYQNKVANYSFLDSKGRAIVVLLLPSPSDLEGAVQRMKKMGGFNKKQAFQE